MGTSTRNSTAVGGSSNGHVMGAIIVILLCVLVRFCVGVFGYSGEGTSGGPIHGDYEAQRHWMEITLNLRSNEWYFNTTNNDLQYWGLDYPPLTAYLSWVYGYM
jgi:alpha-1,3-glucosyltransferase